VWAYRGIRLRQVIFGEQLQICQGLGYVGQVGVGPGTIGKVSYSDGGRRKAGGGLLKNLDLGGALLATPVSWELQAAPPPGSRDTRTSRERWQQADCEEVAERESFHVQS
jgi:hypothetical protein